MRNKMKRITVLMCFVTLSIWLVKIVQALERKNKYDRSVDLYGRSCLTWDIAIQADSKSVANCLSMCSGKRCATVFFNPDKQVCTGYYTWCTDGSCIPYSPGSIAYRFHFDCESDQGRYNTSCYSRYASVISTLTWWGAKEYCASVTNRFQAVPETLEELSYISLWLLNDHPFFVYTYLGVTDADTKGIWRTIHGEQLTYTHWALGQPSMWLYAENCMCVDTNGKLHDTICENHHSVVCERDMMV